MSVISENQTNFVEERSCKTQLPEGVFYNPVQQFNRDVSIAVIEEFCRDLNIKQSQWKPSKSSYYNGIRILEALAASGLRSMRMAREIGSIPECGIKKIIANDIDPIAVQLINENAVRNEVSHLVESSCEDAILLMTKHACNNDRLDVIDLDPYGSASRFLDSAANAITNGGLLCVTCTDVAVLAGAALGTSWGKYGSVTFNKLHARHEMALRVLLHAIQSACGRHGKVIEPLVSLSIDFYVRVFVRVHESPKLVKCSAEKAAMMVECVGCRTFQLQPLGEKVDNKIAAGRWKGLQNNSSSNNNNTCSCPHCGYALQIGGPIWSGPLHDKNFLTNILTRLNTMKTDNSIEKTTQTTTLLPPFGTLPRMIGMLQVASEELQDCPLYYLSDRLASTLHSVTPSFSALRSAFLHAGYRVSLSHCESTSIKTNAPGHVIWHIMRAWAQQSAQQNDKVFPDPKYVTDSKSVYSMLLRATTIDSQQQSTATQCDFIPNFEKHPDAQPPSREFKLARFPPNPEKNWGPKARAKKRQNE